METSKLTKYDLRIGNMFEQGIVWKISGRAGAKVHLHGKGKWYKGFRSEVDVSQLKPIELTEKIITDWCGAHIVGKNISHIGYKINDLVLMYYYNSKTVVIDLGQYEKHIKYLHELQNLFCILEEQELEIKG